MASDAGEKGESSGDAALPSITVKFTSSDKAAGKVEMSLDSSVADLKTAIRAKFDVEPKRVIFQGRILNKDEQTLAESKLKDGLTVVVQAAPATPASTASPAASATPTPMPIPATAAGTAVGSSAAASQAAIAQALAGRLGGLGAGAASVSPVGQAVATIRGQEPGVARECLTTLTKVVDNVIAHPLEEKYRKIKRTNAGFRRKVGSVPGGEACMRALGFGEVDGSDGSWILHPSAAAWTVLTSGRAEIQTALLSLPPATGSAGSSAGARGIGDTPGFLGGMGVMPPVGAAGSAAAGGMGGGMGGMGGGMRGPDVAMMEQMLQNPAALQGAMNNPQVQAMLGPEMASQMQDFVSNPGLMSQALNAMRADPSMLDSYAQRLAQNPNPPALQRAGLQVGAQMQATLGTPATGTNPNPGPGFAPPATVPGRESTWPVPVPSAAQPPTAPAAHAPSASDGAGAGEGGGDEGEMTEDELLAEILRRSLEDH